MSLRIFSTTVLTFGLAACGAESAQPEGEAIACAIGEGSSIAENCTLEVPGDGTFVIHHPDGSFRRFTITGGPGVYALADSADRITHAYHDENTGRIDVSVEDDRYEFNRHQFESSSGD